MMERYCSHCGNEIDVFYYKVLDNYLQVKYFETDELNCFCSEECFCKYVMLEMVCAKEDEEEENETD